MGASLQLVNNCCANAQEGKAISRNGSGVYSLPAGSTVTDGTTIEATQHNTPLQDLETDANTARPIVAGGTGATTASGARTALGLGTISTQASDSVDIDGGAIDGTPIGANSASTGAFTTLSASGNAAFDTNVLYVDATSDEVGIGTTNPDAKLHVASGATDMGILVESTDSGAQIGFVDDSTTSPTYVRLGAVGDDMRFVAGESEAMRIKSTGFVGVGTASPTGSLHVQVASSGVTASAAADDFVVESNNTVGLSLLSDATKGCNIFFGDGDDNDIGKIGYSHGSNTITLTANTVDVMVVRAPSGNEQVGIGTSNPTETLDVNGTLRVRTGGAPASAGASGDTGQIAWDSNYIYVCVASNTWKRAALSTW